MRRVGVGFLAALLVALAGGCKKSPSTETPETKQTQAAPPSAPPVQTVARVHWLGKKRLATESNAAAFMAIWNLPESARLEAQTLDKLALAPWRSCPPGTNQPSTLNPQLSTVLRPLLDDLVQEESYLEIRNATNQPGELALAIRLNAQRAALWETNLAAVLESLTGTRPTPVQGANGGWQLLITNQLSTLNPQLSALRCLQLTRAGDWTILGLAPDKNALAADLLARIQKDQAPCPAPATNYWVEADVDLLRAASALACGWNLPQDLPKVSLGVIGDGENVRTRGELHFSKPLPIENELWNIPTDLINEPLVSFTAIRGLKSWLASLKMWQDLRLGTPPNQLYCWAHQGIPFLTYCAAPLREASTFLDGLAGHLVREGNPWMQTNGVGTFERSETGNGVNWAGLVFMSPYVKLATAAEGDFVFGGLAPNSFTNRPPPDALLQQVYGQTNLLYYDWEITGPRLHAWTDIGQLLRLALNKAQLPFESASLAWFKATEPKLGNCATVVLRTEPDQLSFVRKSAVGFSSLELHLLADWMESPQFPQGCHTLLAPLPPLPGHKARRIATPPSQ